MSVLDTIISGVEVKPPRVVVYGAEGVGKSTLGAGAPRPIFIQTEDGLRQIDCNKFPLVKSYGDFVQQLNTVVTEKHDFETLVVDSLDWLERLIWAEVCAKYNVAHIELADGGFGRGYKYALTHWRDLLEGFDAACDRGMGIILISHAKVEKFVDPDTAAYDRHTLRLEKAAGALVVEWCDAVLFATKKVRVVTEDAGFSKTRSVAKAVGADGGERILRTVGGPACVAKNRYDLPAEIPLTWASVEQHLNAKA